MEFRRSAFKHGIAEADIVHAVSHPLAIHTIDDTDDEPKVLTIGPALDTSLVEVIGTIDAGGELTVFHAMRLRRIFFHLL